VLEANVIVVSGELAALHPPLPNGSFPNDVTLAGIVREVNLLLNKASSPILVRLDGRLMEVINVSVGNVCARKARLANSVTPSGTTTAPLQLLPLESVTTPLVMV
jgi:hypothetical protein